MSSPICCCGCLVAKSYLTLCDPMDRGVLWLWDFPGKNTGVDCYFLLQGIFLIQGLNPCLPHWQADSITTELPEKPCHPLARHIRLFLHWSPPTHSHWGNSSSSSSNPFLLKPSFTLSTTVDRASHSHLCATIATRAPSS